MKKQNVRQVAPSLSLPPFSFSLFLPPLLLLLVSCVTAHTALSPSEGCHDSFSTLSPSPPYAGGSAESALLHHKHFFILFISPRLCLPAERFLCSVLNKLNEDMLYKAAALSVPQFKLHRRRKSMLYHRFLLLWHTTWLNLDAFSLSDTRILSLTEKKLFGVPYTKLLPAHAELYEPALTVYLNGFNAAFSCSYSTTNCPLLAWFLVPTSTIILQ